MGLIENLKSNPARNIPWLLDRIYPEPGVFYQWQRQGTHISQDHFYQLIPHTDKCGESRWLKPLSVRIRRNEDHE